MEPTMEGVAEFYAGKSVLITGVAGFVGEFLLEALLRCCPGIQTVYGVLRDKKGVKAEDRKEALFKKKIFKKLLKQSPEALKKFQLVLGDVSMPNLSINETDLRIITQNVSIVFHAAANITFLKPAKIVLTNNAFGTHYVVELCKKMKNLQALIYTSTAYSNCNHKSKIKEIIYRLPHTADYYIDTILTGTNEDCEQMMSECKPVWPNSYTFSKCLAENILLDQASDLKVAIIRPSSVFLTWKEPLVGYVEDNSAVATFSIATGKGFLRTFNGDVNILCEMIPVDVVVNTHIIASYLTATERVSSPFVVNCVCYGKIQETVKDYYATMMKMLSRYPLPGCFQTPNFNLKVYESRVAYLISATYHHYIPAYVLDGLLKLSGKKPKLVPLYRFADRLMSKIRYFVENTWAFETDNFDKLESMIPHKDAQVFYTDLTGYNLETISNSVHLSSPFYDWNKDKRTPEERMKIARQRNMQWVFIQRATLFCFFVLLYLVISLIFFKAS